MSPLLPMKGRKSSEQVSVINSILVKVTQLLSTTSLSQFQVLVNKVLISLYSCSLVISFTQQ